jgi:hypothetical protein
VIGNVSLWRNVVSPLFVRKIDEYAHETLLRNHKRGKQVTKQHALFHSRRWGEESFPVRSDAKQHVFLESGKDWEEDNAI